MRSLRCASREGAEEAPRTRPPYGGWTHAGSKSAQTKRRCRNKRAGDKIASGTEDAGRSAGPPKESHGFEVFFK
jgi:hypothetical protein